MKPKIAIFQPHEDTFTNPTLVNFLTRLAALDFSIDLYTPSAPEQQSAYIREELLRFPTYPILQIVWETGIRAYMRRLKNFPNNIKFAANIREKQYDLVFAIDPDGLMAAHKLIKKNPAPLFYFSFEIFFRHELHTSWERKLKRREIRASRSIDCIIVQDEQRWELLKRENDIPHNNVVFMPVAPAGAPETKKTEYLRTKFDIAPEKKVVLFSQGLGSWTGVEKLVEQAHTWPDRFILVIHSRNFVNDPVFLDNIKRNCDPNKVRFDLEPVPFDRYAELVSSADIGLVLRQPSGGKYTGDNIRYVGLSSGTLSTYMKHGLPVISNNEQSHKDIFSKYGCGIYIRDLSEIKATLPVIEEDYETMRNNCFAFFEGVLSFDNHYHRLMEKMMAYLNELDANRLLRHTG
ncbi:MAG: hypothetical protein HYX91_01740 [Chloroflexi bacterium]|nr:hypothetical protein [Chloroflexota bacterium]